MTNNNIRVQSLSNKLINQDINSISKLSKRKADLFFDYETIIEKLKTNSDNLA